MNKYSQIKLKHEKQAKREAKSKISVGRREKQLFFFLRSFICLEASSLIKNCNDIMLSSFFANFID